MFLDPEHYHVVHATPNSDRALVECMYLNSGEESVGDMPPRQLFFVNTKSGEVVGRRIDGRQNVSAVSVWNEIAPQWAIEGVSAPDVRRQPPFDSLTECIDWLKNRHRLLGLSDQEDADAVIEDNGSLALGH
jgi:hypothetical protein